MKTIAMPERMICDLAMKAAENGSAAVQRTADVMPDVQQKLEVAAAGMVIMWLTFEALMEESENTRAIFHRTIAWVKAVDQKGQHE